MKDKEVIILFSGGFDSTLLLEMALSIGMRPHCLLIDYGQVHKQELTFAVKSCEHHKVTYEIIKINLKVKSKLTDGVEQYEGVSEWHVPARNGIFVMLAASIAESMGVDLIWYGANYPDREARFPDCYQEWVYSMNQLLQKNGSRTIVLEAPLLGMSKELIKGLATELFNITDKIVFSGYGEKENN